MPDPTLSGIIIGTGVSLVAACLYVAHRLTADPKPAPKHIRIPDELSPDYVDAQPTPEPTITAECRECGRLWSFPDVATFSLDVRCPRCRRVYSCVSRDDGPTEAA